MAKLLDGTRVYGSFTANTAVIAGSMNVAPTISAAFDKANSANLLAFNTGIGANTYANTIGIRSNSWANSVAVVANNFASATIAGANAAVGIGANNWANTVGVSANSFTSATIAGANAAVGIGANSWANSVAVVANNFASATIAGANAAVGIGANSWANSVAVVANNFASATIAGANAAVGIGANNYANGTFVKLIAGNQTITGNLAVTGSLIISGNAFSIDTETLKVSDPLIYLAGNNYSSDIIDIGFVANYVNSTGYNVHTGFFRDATVKQYYLFDSYDKEPVPNHIDTAANNFTLSTLNANFITSNLILGGINTIPWITSAYDKANAANLLAFNTGIEANNWANTVAVVANNFASATIAGANAAVGVGANTYANTIGIRSNSWANTVAVVANNFASATIAGANAAVGIGANNWANSVAVVANNFASATIAGANAAVGVGANTYANTIGIRSNSWANIVGVSANSFASATIAGANAISIAAFAEANTSVQNNSTTLITTGYTVQPWNAGVNVAAFGTWTPNPANGNYQFANSNGAFTLAAPVTNCAIDILFSNGTGGAANGARTITFSGFKVQSGGTGDTYATTANAQYILSIRRINNIATYVWKALQ